MTDAVKSLEREMAGSLACWNSFEKANKNMIHLVYSYEAGIHFFNIMRYLPSRLYKHSSLHIPVGTFHVENTELIPYLKKKSGLEFNEIPYAIVYECNDKYYLYNTPITQYDHLDDIVSWLLSVRD
jgi:hypothetical protein